WLRTCRFVHMLHFCIAVRQRRHLLFVESDAGPAVPAGIHVRQSRRSRGGVHWRALRLWLFLASPRVLSLLIATHSKSCFLADHSAETRVTGSRCGSLPLGSPRSERVLCSGDLQVAMALRSSAPEQSSGELRSPWRPEGRRYGYGVSSQRTPRPGLPGGGF